MDMENKVLKGYMKVFERMPAFLQAYPPERYGCDVASEPYSPVSLEVLDRLTSVSPDDATEILLDIAKRPRVKVTITLRDYEQGGRIVDQRSAVCPVETEKDYETAETVALQRVLAARGFDGKSMYEEEQRDFERQQLVPADPAPVASAPTEAPKKRRKRRSRGDANNGESQNIPTQPSMLGQEETPEPEPKAKQAEDDKEVTPNQQEPRTESAESDSTPTAVSRDRTCVALQRQVVTLARQCGVDAPDPIPSDQDSLRQLTKKLLQQKKNGRGAHARPA